MRQKKLLAYSLGLVLSNKYLDVIVGCLKFKIFNEQAEVLFYKIKNPNKTSTFLLNILGYRHCMMSSKYLFGRAKSNI